MKKLLLFSGLLLIFIFSFNFTGRNDDDPIDALSQFPSGTFNESDFLVPNDSCATLNPERHDDFTHENGYLNVTDSSRWVHKLRPAQYPWTYTKICVGWTKTGATTSLTYDVIIYDSTATGPGTQIAIYPGQTISGIPQFPGMIWSSTVVNVPVTSGAIYAGIRYDNNPNLSIYISVDQTPPNWPVYQATGLTYPPTWTLFTAATALCVRAEGQPAGGGNTYYSSNWCPANTYPALPTAQLYQASAWIGDTLFVADAGSSGTGGNIIRRYTLGGTWTVGVPLPVNRVGGTLTSAAGKMYYIGGSSSSVATGSTDIYEYSAGTWTLKAPMPVALSGHSTVNWGDSVLFVLCGPWSSGGTGVYAYRIASNTWITSTSFTGAARRSQAGGISGNKIFIAGGFPFTNTFYIGTIGSNASTITWVAGPNIPVSPGVTGLSRVGGVAMENAFYVVNGERGTVTGPSDSVHVWSISGNAWVRAISGKPGGGASNIFAAVTAKKVNDTVKVFLPGYHNTVTAFPDFNVVGCGPNIFTGLIPVNNEIPSKFTLSQNYPNPFNPVTNIKFSIPNAANVKLVVYDILGREVAKLIDEFKPAGNYLVDFNASNFASGVYFYTIKANDFTETKKMLLIK